MTEHAHERGIRAPQRPTRLVILGHPVAHSLSPVFQSAALRAAGLEVRYDREDTAPGQLSETLSRLATEGAGGNITIPHKEAAAALMTRCTSIAQRVGAVNTFWTEHGALVGHNTDVDGAAATVRALLPLDGRGASDAPVVLLGAGGSAAAVLIALHDCGLRAITIVARTPGRAEALCERLGIRVRTVASDNTDGAIQSAALVINATPVGMRDDAFPIAVHSLPANCAVFDLVYRAGGTPWVVACREAGLRAEDGLRMLVEQGAAAFEVWFDVPAPRDAMWRALDAAPPLHDRQ